MSTGTHDREVVPTSYCNERDCRRSIMRYWSKQAGSSWHGNPVKLRITFSINFGVNYPSSNAIWRSLSRSGNIPERDRAPLRKHVGCATNADRVMHGTLSIIHSAAKGNDDVRWNLFSYRRRYDCQTCEKTRVRRVHKDRQRVGALAYLSAVWRDIVLRHFN